MKQVNQMTDEEINKAFAIVMDSSEQDRLMSNPKDPEAWMLDFVYDSVLFKELEDHIKFSNQVKSIKSDLETTLNIHNISEIKSKV